MEHEGLLSKKVFSKTTIAGLALFSMLFGAGNLILPIRSGIIAGNNQWAGLLGFLFSGVGLPFLGLWGIVLFDGDYQRFFYRLGKPIGKAVIALCFIILGPLIAIPRIVILLQSLISKHLPFTPPTFITQHPLVFIFLALTCLYLLTFREYALMRILMRFFCSTNDSIAFCNYRY